MGETLPLSDAWEQEAANWIRWARTPGHDSYWRFHRDQFFSLLPLPGKLTLDIGCGEGRLPRDLKARGHRVIGVDASPSLIAAAAAADPAGDYRCAPATALPLEDGCVDLAVAFMSLHDIDDLPLAVSEIARVLTREGTACIAIVHPLNSAGTFAGSSDESPFVIRGSYIDEFNYSEGVVRDGLPMTFHSRHRPLQKYSESLERCGFVIQAIREHPVPSHAIAPGNSAKWQRIPMFMHLRARKSRDAMSNIES